jgi:hypothetical protein
LKDGTKILKEKNAFVVIVLLDEIEDEGLTIVSSDTV